MCVFSAEKAAPLLLVILAYRVKDGLAILLEFPLGCSHLHSWC